MANFLNCSKLFLKRNASTILTCVGGVGVIATSVMAVKATPKALKSLEEAEKQKGEKLTTFEVVTTAGPAYIPAIVMGASTIACIFGANALNKRQQAALMSAYALLNSSYNDYKKQVGELYGEDAHDKVKEEIAKDKYEKVDVQNEDDGKQLFYDDFSQQMFRATTEQVLQAEYAINKTLARSSGAYLNEFYELLGIPQPEYGDYLGWSSAELFDTYWNSWIDFEHKKVVMDDGLECTIITFSQDPTYDFENY